MAEVRRVIGTYELSDTSETTGGLVLVVLVQNNHADWVEEWVSRTWAADMQGAWELLRRRPNLPFSVEYL